MGMGDVKLLAALGLYLGPFVVLAIFIGSLFGLVSVVATHRGARRDQRLPFGPFLALGGYVVAYWGPSLVGWYLGLI